MKKLIVIGIVATMVMGLAMVASASVNDRWEIDLRATTGLGGAPYLAIVTAPGASNSYVEGEDTTGLTPMDEQAGIMSTLRANCNQDTRAGLATGTTTWNLKVIVSNPLVSEVDGTYLPYDVTLSAWNVNLTSATGPGTTVELWDGTSKLYTFGALGTQQNPNYSKTISFTDDGTFSGVGNGYYKTGLKLVATYTAAPVPEPGSMVAMLSGLVGLVGYGIRRRK